MPKDEASPSASLLSSPYDTSAHTKRRGRPSSTGLSCCLRTPACPHSLAKTRPPLQPPFVELALGHCLSTHMLTQKKRREADATYCTGLSFLTSLCLRFPSLSVGYPRSVPVLSWLFSAGRSKNLRCEAHGKCTAVAFHRKIPTLVRARPHRFLRRRASPSPGAVPFLLLDPSPTGSALRANPFPKVTDPFCRLPWSID
ncbi:hypothetical protein HPB50_022035 [Hyalomma asiaticum]|uniref:Uncharacterized protein n=1 Tax=Hyalomma asiaticum TaxID=266040 RepID=A0ACB7SY85_HYAAI|nr:hypothetical protein HPB50_022035 [Hyalomma asiaticum]